MIKKVLKILLVFLLIIAVAGLYLFFTQKNTPEDAPEKNIFSFFPFGNNSQTTPQTGLPNEGGENPEVDQNPDNLNQRIKRLSNTDIAGATLFEKERIVPAVDDQSEDTVEMVLVARYIQKEDGHVYDIFVDTLKTELLSSTIIPRIHEAFFGDNPNEVILRYLKSDNETIETFGGTIENGSIKGLFFPKNIPILAISPDKTKVFYLTEEGEYTKGTISSFANKNKKPIFENAFSEWVPWWGTDSIITMTTKSSANIEGSVYGLSATTGVLSKQFGEKDGLTTLTSPNGQKILYSEKIDGGIKLFLYNKQKNTHVNLGIKTLPEKCTWDIGSVEVYCAVPKEILSANLPDDWYQGLVSFRDSIWLLDTDSIAHQEILDPFEEQFLSLDIINILISDKKDYMIFADKKTSLLYGTEI